MSFLIRISGFPYIVLFILGGLAQTQQWVRLLDYSHDIHGPTADIILRFEVEEGFHIQSHRPEDPMLIPTELTIQWPEGIQNDTVLFPPAKNFPLLGTESILQVYDSVFMVQVPVVTPRAMGKGQYKIPGSLKYQACDDRKCFFPRELTFTLRIWVN